VQSLNRIDCSDHESVVLAHRNGAWERLSRESAEVSEVALVQGTEHELTVVLMHDCRSVEGCEYVW
jgi:hypothetical protein